MRGITLGLLASALLVVGAPAAYSMSNCKMIPSWCPPPSGLGDHHHHPTPEPGTIGLLILGAAGSIGMLRRKKR